MNVARPHSFAKLVHPAVIVLFAAFLCLPILLVGIPESGDGSTHVKYQYHFSHQFWHGDFYPRWLAATNKGDGSPIFLIQYPFPYFAAALLRPLLHYPANSSREAHELGIYCFLVLAAAGLAARGWYRHRCGPLASTIGALAYIALPYIVGQTIYDRVSLGELAGFIWMPLMFSLCDRIDPPRFPVVSGIGVLFALLIWSNVLTAALFAPVIVLYALLAGGFSWTHVVKRAIPLLLAFLIGIGVAATYIFPLAAYKRLFDAGAVPRNHPYAELGRSLLSISRSDFAHYRIIIPGIAMAICLALLVAFYAWRVRFAPAARLLILATLGLSALMLIPGFGSRLVVMSHLEVSGFDSYNGFVARMLFTALFTAGLGMIAYCRVAGNRSDVQTRLLLVISCATLLGMLPWSAILWKTIPGVGAAIQFPWRFGAILTVAAGGLFAIAVENALRNRATESGRPSLVMLIVIAVAVIATSNLIWRVNNKFLSPESPRMDLTCDVDPMYPTYVPPAVLTAFAQSVGTSPATWEVAPAPFVEGIRADVISGQGKAQVTRNEPRRILVSVQSSGDIKVRIGQLYFPLWKIVPVGQASPGASLSSSDAGLLEVSLGPGRDDFWLVFDCGRPARWGDIVTLVSLLLVAAGLAASAIFTLRQRCTTAKQAESVWFPPNEK